MGDPFIVYEEEKKVFYLYGTTRASLTRNNIYDNFEIYSSLDLKSWGKVSDAFDETVRINSWMDSNLDKDARFWAPEVHKFGEYYYMTYSANYFGSKYYSVGHAVSDNPLTGFVKPKENAMIMGLSRPTC